MAELLGGSVPQFWWDEKEQVVWFGCPHEPGVSVLDVRWTVVTKDPLTVTPSIHNTGCGCHGFITDGKWVPA
jgi:hypothetical protein